MSSTSHPGGNQVDGLPPAPVPMQSNWLPGWPRNNNCKWKYFSDFEDVPTIYFSSHRFNPLNFKISYSYMLSICQCYHLVSRTAGGKFFAKDKIAVFLLLHLTRRAHSCRVVSSRVIPVRSYWLPGRPRTDNSVLKCFFNFEDVRQFIFLLLGSKD